MSGKFFYFAYGSNLLTERLHMLNKSAVFKDVARLENFKLIFGFMSERWQGHAASIEESPNSTVWGVVYELDNSDLQNLDKQEGVKSKIYKPISVKVNGLSNKVSYECRTYQLTRKILGPPSPQYKDVIVRGAKQHHLPSEYIENLTAINDNGNTKEVPIYNELLKIIGEKPIYNI